MIRTCAYISIFLMLLGAGLEPLRGDQPTAKDASSALDQTTIAKVIGEAAKRLEDRYVFPEVGVKMSEMLRRRQKDGEYAKVVSGPEFATLLTKQLQEISKDKHLRVRYSAEKLTPPPKGGPTPEMIARRKQMTIKSNAGFRKVERLPGNVGYIAFDFFADTEEISGPAATAMNFVANTDALILDLRQNGGGSPQGVQVVCSYLFPPEPSVHLNSLYFRPDNRTDDFWTLKDLAGSRFTVKPVYVLTSARTFSGAEECAYNLQTRKRATIVGETTGGGAHPGGSAPLTDHFAMFVPVGRAINPVTKTNWEGVGVKPEVAIPADQALDAAHKLAIDKIMAAAPDDEARSFIKNDLERSKDRR